MMAFTAADASFLALDWYSTCVGAEITDDQARSLRLAALNVFAEYRLAFKTWDVWCDCVCDCAHEANIVGSTQQKGGVR